MRAADRAWIATAATLWLLVAGVWAAPGAAGRGQPEGAAALVTTLASGRVDLEARRDILDAPVLPGSVMKAWTLVAALESGVIEPGTARLCRRTVVVEGRRYVCAHPDLKRPLTPAEALAHSCNDYFVSLAPRLPRGVLDSVRLAAGLPALGAATPLAAGLVGLEGPRVSPRVLLTGLARLAGVQPEGRVSMRAETRRVLLEGLRGAATYGSASALASTAGGALAKTGTAPMPGGGHLGLVVALAPAAVPTRAVVVVVPGAAGLDAAGIAADLLAAPPPPPPSAAPRPASPGPSAPPPAAPAATPQNVTDVALRAASAGTTVRLGVTTRGRVRVQVVALEEYVARVVAGEGQPRAGDAAQQALAVAARTFALANRGRHQREGHDLCDTTHCQVTRPSTPVTRRAALATAGQLLLTAGRPASIFYSALCGGRPERASEVWPGAEDYGAPPEDDDACRSEPAWTSDIPAAGLERALRAAGLRGSRLRELRVVQQNATGRATRLRAEGFSPNEISAQDFRMAVGRVLGWQHLRSTQFDLRRTSAGYRFTGRGFGHGVGLCVIGAGYRAARGETGADILGFYFPGLSVGPLGSAATSAAAPAPPRAPAPAPPA
ncbi:MAG: SpoIID/LytB domain-containing protein, partial [Vicinamibacterales bacterium]|nr:SpoIID/LytB domain-containing protein [Vicinamibacterales bacterium]